MRSSRRKVFSLLLGSALLLPALALPAGLGGAAAQNGGQGKGKQKQKTFGSKHENVSVDAPGAAARGLTGPNPGKARDVALGHLKQNRHKLGLAEEDLSELKVTDEYTDRHNGVTHVYLRQQIGGIEVAGAEASTNVARDGRVLNLHSSFVKNLRGAANRQAPALSPDAAVQAAAAYLGLTPTEPLAILEADSGPARRTAFNTGGISQDPINVKLVYQPVDSGSLRLAWAVEIYERDGQHAWDIKVDAENGDVLAGDDLVDHDNWGAEFAPDVARNQQLAAVAAAARPASAASAALPTAADGSGYNVFALPLENPNDGGRTLVTNPADALASPFGWHDTNGADGPEFTRTRGNNVHAYTDVDDNNIADVGSDPDGGPSLQFNFPWNDATTQPAGYRPAAVTNLFYWNNIVHDVFYRYGFNEQAGNFQVNNYGRGPTAPAANDDVRAEAQDGSGTNNANFFTPADGQRPRMQMYVWNYPFSRSVTINSPANVAGTFIAATAAFGPVINANLTGDVEVVNDNDGSTVDACQPLVGFTAGRIALLDRGSCDFVVKVKNAQNAGAVAAIVSNNVDGDPVTMGGTDATITIPALMVAKSTGDLLKANPNANATLGINPNPPPNRDSDFDAGVIAHEYGHGISNRLTGGRNVVNCLNNAEQMGEGWSDFTGLVLTSVPTDTATTVRGVGTYVSFQSPTGRGIRPAPYTTDMTVNPATYDSLKNTATISQPHGVGYVWASMLWEMYWNLVNEHGYNPNVYDSWQTGGNNLAIQLVIDGMKLQPCRPGFVDGRNAIIQADQQLTNGANECLIWKAFAKRGLGFSANQGSNLNRTDGTEAFDLPAVCRADIGVVPPSLSETLTPNTQSVQQLTISNTTKDNGEDLSWSITETATSCATPVDVPWLSAAPTSGTTAAGASSNVAVGFDSTGLAIGTYSAKLCIASNDGSMPTTEVPVTLDVNYLFGGFFAPVANAPAVNAVNSGQAIPLHFTLNGNYGLNIFAAGFPASREVNCTTLAPTGGFTPTETPGNSGLSVSGGGYNYPWKTNKAWTGTCRELVVRTNDGVDHNAYFNFRK